MSKYPLIDIKSFVENGIALMPLAEALRTESVDLAPCANQLMHWLLTDPEMLPKFAQESPPAVDIILETGELYKQLLGGGVIDLDVWSKIQGKILFERKNLISGKIGAAMCAVISATNVIIRNEYNKEKNSYAFDALAYAAAANGYNGGAREEFWQKSADKLIELISQAKIVNEMDFENV